MAANPEAPAQTRSSPSDRDIVVSCQGVGHQFGPKHVLHDVCFDLRRGQIASLVGPSGCGKSTLLRAIVGTHLPQRGQITVVRADGTEHPVVAPGRDRGIVYQNYALFDFLTVQDNVALGPMLDETSPAFRLFRRRAWKALRAQHRQEAEALLVRLGLGDALQRYPTELSGGMRQRVAIAQALIMKPALMLLDEPFGALDEATREDLQRLLLQLYSDSQQALVDGRKEDATTILIVTHELTEAIFVADRVIGLSQYWDWKGAGHGQAPGATIVYDKAAPIYEPNSVKNHEEFVEQRAEVYNAVFSTELLRDHHRFIQFWEQVADGANGDPP